MNSSRKRISGFFKHLIKQQPYPPAASKPRQRGSDRFPVEFRLEVVFMDENGKERMDRAELYDISVGGALFRTRWGRQYHPGQRLRMTVFLWGTKEVKAKLHTDATVVRIHPWDQAPGHTGVAVKFLESFEFQRINPHHWQ